MPPPTPAQTPPTNAKLLLIGQRRVRGKQPHPIQNQSAFIAPPPRSKPRPLPALLTDWGGLVGGACLRPRPPPPKPRPLLSNLPPSRRWRSCRARMRCCGRSCSRGAWRGGALRGCPSDALGGTLPWYTPQPLSKWGTPPGTSARGRPHQRGSGGAPPPWGRPLPRLRATPPPPQYPKIQQKAPNCPFLLCFHPYFWGGFWLPPPLGKLWGKIL